MRGGVARFVDRPAAKLDRLLRHVRVPIGLLTNRREVRLIYAPHGETSGSLTFRLNDMAQMPGGPGGSPPCVAGTSQ